jgi:hypothetical protein
MHRLNDPRSYKPRSLKLIRKTGKFWKMKKRLCEYERLGQEVGCGTRTAQIIYDLGPGQFSAT